MAIRLFGGTWDCSSAIVTTYPNWMMVWVRQLTTSATFSLKSTNSGGTDYFELRMTGTNTASAVAAASSSQGIASGNHNGLNRWVCLLARQSNSGSRILYVNGVTTATDIVNKSPSGLSQTILTGTNCEVAFLAAGTGTLTTDRALLISRNLYAPVEWKGATNLLPSLFNVSCLMPFNEDTGSRVLQSYDPDSRLFVGSSSPNIWSVPGVGADHYIEEPEIGLSDTLRRRKIYSFGTVPSATGNMLLMF